MTRLPRVSGRLLLAIAAVLYLAGAIHVVVLHEPPVALAALALMLTAAGAAQQRRA